MYMLVKGEALVGNQLQGEFHRYGTIRVGSVVGEMSLFDGAPRSADVVASEDTVCYSLTGERFDEFLERHPRVAYALVTGLNQMYSNRLRDANFLLSQVR